MLKTIRFYLFPIKVNYTKCPIQISHPQMSTLEQSDIQGEMRRGLIKAYEMFTYHYNDISTNFNKQNYISPQLGYTMDALRDNAPIVFGTVKQVSLVNHSIVNGYIEEQDKIGGMYSKEEIVEQIIAGLCGPESPMWHYKPQKEVIDVLYTTTHRRDVFRFERDIDKDGDWVLSNINDIIADR